MRNVVDVGEQAGVVVVGTVGVVVPVVGVVVLPGLMALAPTLFVRRNLGMHG